MRLERRLGRRRVPVDTEPLSRMRLRTGRELWVLDVSASGALVEGDARLLPGTHVDVHVMTPEGRVLVRSRIVRAWVARLTADRVHYRGALAFDRPVRVGDGYHVPEHSLDSVETKGTGYPKEAA